MERDWFQCLLIKTKINSCLFDAVVKTCGKDNKIEECKPQNFQINNKPASGNVLSLSQQESLNIYC